MLDENLMKKSLHILVAHNVSRKRNGGMSRQMSFIHDHIENAGHSVDYLCEEDLPVKWRGRYARFAFPLLVRKRAIEVARTGNPFDIINVHEPNSAVISTWRKAANNPIVAITSYGIEKRAWELALEEGRLGRVGPNLKSRIIYPATSLLQSRIGLL